MTDAQKSLKNYRAFHAKSPDKTTKIKFTAPRTLTLLGRGVSIEYESDKPLYGSRKRRIYRHKFGSGVRLYLHPNRKWVLVGGGRFRVTDWMRD